MGSRKLSPHGQYSLRGGGVPCVFWDALAAPQPDPASEAEIYLRAQQAERQRIAQLLHDTVSQSLTGTYLQARVVAQKVQKDGSESASDISRLVDMLHQVVIEMREVDQHLTLESRPASGSDQTT